MPLTKNNLKRENIFGLDFLDEPELDDVAAELVDLASTGSTAVVVTPNVDILIDLDESPDSTEAAVYRSAEYCLPDGQPIVWASKLLGQSLAARLPGSSLFSKVWPSIMELKIPVTMLASSDEVKDFFSNEYDLANFHVPPRFDPDDEVAVAEIVDFVAKKAVANGSRIIFCGIGQPRDSIIISGVHSSWSKFSDSPPPLFFALGASYMFYAGIQRRAPLWMQKSGLEWFHRFLQEPTRLFHRYFIRSPKFLKIVWREFKKSDSDSTSGSYSNSGSTH